MPPFLTLTEAKLGWMPPVLFVGVMHSSCWPSSSQLTPCFLSRYTFCRAFLATLNELNDYAGQHEVIAENLTSQIIAELSRYLQDLKSERKTVSMLLSEFFFFFFLSPLVCILFYFF